MDLVQLLMKYGLSRSEAETYAKGMGIQDPMHKAFYEKLAADAKLGWLSGLVAQRDRMMGDRTQKEAQADLVAQRDRMMGDRTQKEAQADLVTRRDAMMNRGKEIQMPEDNSPRDKRMELRALADYQRQGYFPGEIQMPVDNSPRDARMAEISRFYNPGGEIQMPEDNSPRNANIDKFYGQFKDRR